jgi:Holliday junction resolvasome RuvABC endonuclease subunit
MNLIGIDLGTRKIAMALFVHRELVHAYAHESAPDLARDIQLGVLASFAHDLCLLHGAASVWIEDTIIGNNRKYSIQLAEIKGAVMGNLSQLRLSQGTDVRLVDNKTWKKEVCGNGNADKAAVRDYIHASHPAYAPLCGDDQDLYDAACIGLYGLGVLERATDLRLSTG